MGLGLEEVFVFDSKSENLGLGLGLGNMFPANIGPLRVWSEVPLGVRLGEFRVRVRVRVRRRV